MADYILDHHKAGERDRLALMSQLLDPMHRRYIESIGLEPGARALEVGSGNGSIAAWLGERTGPNGQVVALDLDLSLVLAPVHAPGDRDRPLSSSLVTISQPMPDGMG